MCRGNLTFPCWAEFRFICCVLPSKGSTLPTVLLLNKKATTGCLFLKHFSVGFDENIGSGSHPDAVSYSLSAPYIMAIPIKPRRSLVSRLAVSINSTAFFQSWFSLYLFAVSMVVFAGYCSPDFEHTKEGCEHEIHQASANAPDPRSARAC